MPLIKPPIDTSIEEVSIRLTNILKEEIEAYNQAFGIKTISHFLSEAAEYILSKDKEWLELKKSEKQIQVDVPA
ncbi:MAG: hypothetical protein JWM09_184 [Francisellaceae bacterium]|nr:hypothetical protein [Francisellaceae bacterium]